MADARSWVYAGNCRNNLLTSKKCHFCLLTLFRAFATGKSNRGVVSRNKVKKPLLDTKEFQVFHTFVLSREIRWKIIFAMLFVEFINGLINIAFLPHQPLRQMTVFSLSLVLILLRGAPLFRSSLV